MPFMLAARRMTRVHQVLVMGSGMLSVGFGLFLAWQIGISDHLFGVTPVWIPH
jgi:high-affinity nickel-transport protein